MFLSPVPSSRRWCLARQVSIGYVAGCITHLLFTGVGAVVPALLPPSRGPEPGRWWPQRDSNPCLVAVAFSPKGSVTSWPLTSINLARPKHARKVPSNSDARSHWLQIVGVLWSDGNNRGPDGIPCAGVIGRASPIGGVPGVRVEAGHWRPVSPTRQCLDHVLVLSETHLRHPQLALGLTLTTPPRRRTINPSSSPSSTSDPTPGQGS